MTVQDPDFRFVRDELLSLIKTLNETVWEGRCALSEVDDWLSNFDGSALGDRELEHLHALHLLSRFLFYGEAEVRVLLRAAFRDHVLYPLHQHIRHTIQKPDDLAGVSEQAEREIDMTRFIGVGGASESGPFLLYAFRQLNKLSKGHFLNQDDLLEGTPHGDRLKHPEVRRYVFLDDLCASGQQITQYATALVRRLRNAAASAGISVEISYVTLFAFSQALTDVSSAVGFDRVEAVHEMDGLSKAFHPDGPTFATPPDMVTLDTSRTMCEAYGRKLIPNIALGYRDSQLLLGFYYNTPDNTLPIIWCDQSHSTFPWRPIFQRSTKA